MRNLNYIKQYKLQLYVLGPVHIGNGEEYNQKEYIELKDAYYFPDMAKVYQEFIKIGLKAVENFERIIIDESDKRRLAEILKTFNISLNGNYGGYKIIKTGFETDRNSAKLNDVHSFVKDPYGLPYVPGSSIKGMLRTLAANWLIANYSRLEDLKGDNKFISTELKKYLDAMFKFISIADSEPLRISDLIITGKYDYSKDKEKSNSNPKSLPIYRESLKPNTIITSSLTVDTSKSGSELAVKFLDQIDSIMVKNYRLYKDKYLDELRAKQEDYITLKDHEKNIVYLGGGSGFWTKTAIKYGDPRRHQRQKNNKMIGNGMYKLTKAKPENLGKTKHQLISNSDNIYEQGKCILNIKEVKG